jgi:hypothetical protein
MKVDEERKDIENKGRKEGRNEGRNEGIERKMRRGR